MIDQRWVGLGLALASCYDYHRQLVYIAASSTTPGMLLIRLRLADGRAKTSTAGTKIAFQPTQHVSTWQSAVGHLPASTSALWSGAARKAHVSVLGVRTAVSAADAGPQPQCCWRTNPPRIMTIVSCCGMHTLSSVSEFMTQRTSQREQRY